MAVEIVGVVDDFYPIERLKAAHQDGVAILELRLDLFDHQPLDKVLKYFKEIRSLNLFKTIGTLRETPYNVWIRRRLFESLATFSDYMDVEVDTVISEELISIVRSQNKKLIISHHYFSECPSPTVLADFWRLAQLASPDIIKVAAMANTKQDLLGLLAFAVEYETACPLAVMAMGEMGPSSRYVAGFFGSVLTYGYLGDQSVVPGQVSAKALGQMSGLFL